PANCTAPLRARRCKRNRARVATPLLVSSCSPHFSHSLPLQWLRPEAGFQTQPHAPPPVALPLYPSPGNTLSPERNPVLPSIALAPSDGFDVQPELDPAPPPGTSPRAGASDSARPPSPHRTDRGAAGPASDRLPPGPPGGVWVDR